MREHDALGRQLGEHLILRLLLLLLLAPLAMAAVPAGPESVACGRYEFIGELTHRDGLNLLRMYPGSTREYEVLVDDLTFKDAMKFRGVMIRLSGEVRAAARGAGIRLLKGKVVATSSQEEAVTRAVTRTADLPCR